MSDVSNLQVSSKLRTDSLSPSLSRNDATNRVSNSFAPRPQSVTGPSNKARGGRRAADYRGFASLGDAEKIFTGVGPCDNVARFDIADANENNETERGE